MSDLDIERMLRSRISLTPIRNTRMIEISAFGGSPDESAQLANELAQAYRRVYHEQTASGPDSARVIIMDSAAPNPIPVRPNKALNTVLGAIMGVLFGAVVAATMAGIIFGIRERRTSADYLQNN
jgi:capsular polysaccharide biosynthesis protein